MVGRLGLSGQRIVRVGPEPNPQPWPLANSDRAASPVERGHQVGEPQLLRTPRVAAALRPAARRFRVCAAF